MTIMMVGWCRIMLVMFKDNDDDDVSAADDVSLVVAVAFVIAFVVMAYTLLCKVNAMLCTFKSG